MDRPALIDLAGVDKFSKTEVGEQAQLLAKLAKKGIPVPRTAVIPRSTLELIVYKSNLADTLKKILGSNSSHPDQQHVLLEQIQHAIRHINLPQKITKEILSWYHHTPGFIKVFVDDDDLSNQLLHENIEGDANLIDSILSVWSQHLHLDYTNQQLKLFAQPILIQHQGQPEISGVALTQSPHSKSQLQILSAWGVYDQHHFEIKPDQINIDVRTKQITQKQLNPQYIQLQRQTDSLSEKAVLHYKQDQLSLDQNQAFELAHLIITVKRSILGNHLVEWYYQAGQFYISSVLAAEGSTSLETNKNKTVLTGDSFQSGIINGTVFHLTHKKQLKDIDFGQVVVVDKLIPQYLAALNRAAAIICDQGFSSPILTKHIQQHSLPTIINTRHATRYLTPGLSVIVDANAGRILIHHPEAKPQPTLPRLTITKTYISAGNPHKAAKYVTNEVDGIGVLRSEYTFASLGEHPLHLLKSRKKQLLKKALKKTIQAYQQTRPNLPIIYRSLDFTSQEYKALAYATNYEPEEINPYLGYRGGLRILNNFDLLDLEVEVIKEVLAEDKAPLGLMLPFVRTPGELQLINNHLLTQHQFKPGEGMDLYLQLNTPENIWQLKNYLRTPLAGVSVNVRSIHALLHGIDPDDPDIYSLYPYDINLMRELLEKVIHDIKTKAILHLENYSLQLVEIATELGFDIITVKPEFAPRVKQHILEIEEQKLHAV